MNGNQISTVSNTDNNDCKSNCKKLYTEFPLFVKIIILITIIFNILNYIFPSISFYLSNIPFYTIYKYQFWRLFSSSLITTNAINVLFTILFWVKHASNLEDNMGTIKYLIIFSLNSTIIQIIFTLLFFIISLIIKNKDFLKNKINNKNKVDNIGIWPYIICELILLSLSNPNHPIKFLFFPEFKAKYYPILVLIIVCVLNSLPIDFEILSGIIYAFIYHFLIKKKIKISNNFVRKVENLGCVKCFKFFGGFISVNKNKFTLKSDNINRRVRNVVVSHDNMKGFVPFKGEGMSVGESITDIGGDKTNTETTQKSQNETLDVKIE